MGLIGIFHLYDGDQRKNINSNAVYFTLTQLHLTGVQLAEWRGTGSCGAESSGMISPAIYRKPLLIFCC